MMQKLLIKSTLLKLLLLNLLLTISCTHKIPLPDVKYFGAFMDISQPGFYSVDVGGDKEYRSWGDDRMHGAQCLPIEDFYKLQLYIEKLREQEVFK